MGFLTTRCSTSKTEIWGFLGTWALNSKTSSKWKKVGSFDDERCVSLGYRLERERERGSGVWRVWKWMIKWKGEDIENWRWDYKATRERRRGDKRVRKREREKERQTEGGPCLDIHLGEVMPVWRSLHERYLFIFNYFTCSFLIFSAHKLLRIVMRNLEMIMLKSSSIITNQFSICGVHVLIPRLLIL